MDAFAPRSTEIGLMKIDVERDELAVLDGAARLCVCGPPGMRCSHFLPRGADRFWFLASFRINLSQTS
jgi:hypothetical protein